MCVHHWILESPSDADGSDSVGVCKHCGAERSFPNAAQDWTLRDKAIAQSGFPKRGPRDPFALADER